MLPSSECEIVTSHEKVTEMSIEFDIRQRLDLGRKIGDLHGYWLYWLHQRCYYVSAKVVAPDINQL